jgi:hypothetical protein
MDQLKIESDKSSDDVPKVFHDGFNPDAVKIVPRTWNPRTFPKRELPDYLKFDPVLFQFFKRVHYDDKNFIAVVVGETG